MLCPECFGRIRFVRPPVCEACGRPLPLSGEACPCRLSRRGPAAIRRRRFALVYDEGSAPLILRFKHADRPDLAGRLAAWMARAGADLIADADVLMPVPLHWTRLAVRQYNQAAELARRLAREGGRHCDVMGLVRRHPTPSQGHRGAAARRRNVRGAFAVRPGTRVAGLTVLLIDDVTTTGATAEECARVLLRAGAAAVDLLTVAAVPLGEA